MGSVMYRIDGPLFFGAVYKFREAMAEIGKPPKVLILEMQDVPVVDGTGIHALKEAFKMLRKFGTKFIISGIHSYRQQKLERGGILDYVPKENFCKTTQEGIELARKLVL
jgi:SulP family sulfate permease